MAWTAPRTYVVGEVMTAAIFNTHIRDNLLQAAPAIVTTQGDTVYATAANALARLAKGTAAQEYRMNTGVTAPEWFTRAAQTNEVATEETTASNTYVDLATGGPSITLSPGVTQSHLLLYSVRISPPSGQSAWVGLSIAGGAASDDDAIVGTNDALSAILHGHKLATAQASGATHALKYRVSGGTGTFSRRRITGVAL